MATRKTTRARKGATASRQDTRKTASKLNSKSFHKQLLALAPQSPVSTQFDALRKRLIAMMPEAPASPRRQAGSRKTSRK